MTFLDAIEYTKSKEFRVRKYHNDRATNFTDDDEFIYL